MRVAIHQPNYAPWCGYFAKMRACDVFVFLDDVQMPSGRSYVSRCRVRTAQGPLWLTVPTHHAPEEPIRDVRFADPRWPRKHLGTLQTHYGRATHAREVLDLLAPLYADPGEHLGAFNMRLVRAVAGYLGLPCRFDVSSSLSLPEQAQGDDRLLGIAAALRATTYVSGQGGQNYQDPEKFARRGIALEVRAYQPVPYPQIHGAFEPGLSVLDALCHLGRETLALLAY